MKIHETAGADGMLTTTSLEVYGDRLVVVSEGERRELPDGSLDAVMKRYGAPLEPRERLAEIAALDLPAARLRHVRHLARYDVIARDYLVYEADGEALCALANTVASALAFLARRA